ncbi:organic cation transporter-like protein [Plodia interpunctella]|uniref:organic cation transporter-like protein n=1 Tax=Plodia interpunctella TaxID=58824 RepID=UPI002368E7C4|nr:organic cation transporter-like protein [Plodia interpunctella]XP_053611155.1 organic cation transporter-like protein [Plodia interpunctella]XP_053611156.1 organic cation transporter-like protein [Plodia interpunctella]
MKIVSKNKKEKLEKVYEIWEAMEFFGKYQKIQYLYVCIATAFVAMYNINYIFVAGDINYRCRVPQCEGTPATYRADWWPNTTMDRCSKPILNSSDTCAGFIGSVEPCDAWIYESNDTIVGELDLACQPLKINIIGTIHNVGMLISMILSGWISDRFGRKPAFIFFATASCVGVLKSFANSYLVYVTIECLEAALSGGTYPAGMVIMIEMGGRNNRVLSGVLFAYAIYVGESGFAIAAMMIPYWRSLIRILYTPIVLCLSLIFVMSESPRWQFLNGKTEEAIANIENSAKMNKIDVNKQRDIEKLKEKLCIRQVGDRESYKKIFTSREILLRLFVASASRFTTSFVYYGLMINSVWLPGNKYMNFVLSTVMSFPGELVSLYLMNRVGRKLPLVIGFIVCGVMCLGSAFVPKVYTWAMIAMFLLAKMVMSACFTGAVTYAMELFPTNARGTLLGVCALSSRAGGMLAPLTPMLTDIYLPLPAIIFGSTSIVCGALLTLTPETRLQPLLDTVDQVEASAKTTPPPLIT